MVLQAQSALRVVPSAIYPLERRNNEFYLSVRGCQITQRAGY
jgi:hypothetical protein